MTMFKIRPEATIVARRAKHPATDSAIRELKSNVMVEIGCAKP